MKETKRNMKMDIETFQSDDAQAGGSTFFILETFEQNILSPLNQPAFEACLAIAKCDINLIADPELIRRIGRRGSRKRQKPSTLLFFNFSTPWFVLSDCVRS